MSLHSRCCSDYREELMWQQSWNIQESKKPIAGPQIRLMLQQVWFIPSLHKWPTTWHRVSRVGWKWASDGIIFSPPRMILLNRVLEWLYHQKYPHYTRYEIPLGWYQKLQKTNALKFVSYILLRITLYCVNIQFYIEENLFRKSDHWNVEENNCTCTGSWCKRWSEICKGVPISDHPADTKASLIVEEERPIDTKAWSRTQWYNAKNCACPACQCDRPKLSRKRPKVPTRLHPRWQAQADYSPEGWSTTQTEGGSSLKQTIKLSFKVLNQHIMWMARGTNISWGKAMKSFWYKLSKKGRTCAPCLVKALPLQDLALGNDIVLIATISNMKWSKKQMWT